MRLRLALFALSTTALAATLADREIATLVHRIEALSATETPHMRADTLLRAGELLRSVDPAKAAVFAAEAKLVTGFQPPPLIEERHQLESAIERGGVQHIQRAAERFVTAVEHSPENPDDYAWYAALRRKHDLVPGGDNASIRIREAFLDLARLLDTGYDARLTGLDGAAITLGSRRGKTVLLAFWATWCAPCQEEMQVLERLWRARKDGSFALLAITDEPRDVVKAFLTGTDFTFAIALDPHRRVFEHYGVNTLPASVILDRTGRLRAESARLSESELNRLVDGVAK